MVAYDLAYHIFSRTQTVIHTEIPDKNAVFINAEHNITPGEVRSTRSIKSGVLKSNAAAPIGPPRELSAENIVKVCRRVNVKYFIIGGSHGIRLIETFNVAVDFTVCLFNGFNTVFIKPDRKLSLYGAPHTLNAALCLRRPRQDLMDMQFFANALPLGAFFVHYFEFFPLSKVRATWSETKDSGAVGINLARHAVGPARLTQDLKVAIKTFILGEVQAGDFTGRVVNSAGETIAFIVPGFVEPRKRSAVDLHKVALTIAPEPRPVNRFFLFDFVSLRGYKAVVFHNTAEGY